MPSWLRVKPVNTLLERTARVRRIVIPRDRAVLYITRQLIVSKVVRDRRRASPAGISSVRSTSVQAPCRYCVPMNLPQPPWCGLDPDRWHLQAPLHNGQPNCHGGQDPLSADQVGRKRAAVAWMRFR